MCVRTFPFWMPCVTPGISPEAMRLSQDESPHRRQAFSLPHVMSAYQVVDIERLFCAQQHARRH